MSFKNFKDIKIIFKILTRSKGLGPYFLYKIEPYKVM